MIKYKTAGESHGRCCTAILEGIPAGLGLEKGYIIDQLTRRQLGIGRGGRMQIETDQVEITAGVRWGETTGAPICLVVDNRDWDNNKELMDPAASSRDESQYLTKARPGHADLAGALKYDRHDIRDILERASARETAARVAAGAVAKRLLEELGIKVTSFTTSVGGLGLSEDISGMTADEVMEITQKFTNYRCLDGGDEKKMEDAILKAKSDGDTLGGTFKVVAFGVPAGLGSHTQWDLKLDARIAQALMSIQAIKGVECGIGFEAAGRRGSQVHDPIMYDKGECRFTRPTNNAGGIEGGMTNGEALVFKAAMKPISTLRDPLDSVDIATKKKAKAEVVRSDVSAVVAAGVVGEAVVCLELARALKEKTGGDSIIEMKRNFEGYLEQLKEF